MNASTSDELEQLQRDALDQNHSACDLDTATEFCQSAFMLSYRGREPGWRIAEMIENKEIYDTIMSWFDGREKSKKQQFLSEIPEGKEKLHVCAE